MKPYNVEIFTPAFRMVGNTNIDSVTYKEDYLSGDENTITILPVKGVSKQDYIRISRGEEEYAGVITEITYGTDKSKNLMQISYKPLMELFDTDILFDVSEQGKGSLEDYICRKISEMFIENEDAEQNIPGLSVETASSTTDWYFHITPAQAGGHFHIVNLMDSIIIPALSKYSIVVKAGLDIQNRAIRVCVGRAGMGVVTIEADLPNIIKKSLTIKSVSADVNKLVLYDAASDYADKRVYFLHASDLGYDTFDRDRITPVVCEMKAVEHDENSSFESAAMNEAHNRFASLSYSNLIELTMLNGDSLVRPDEMSFGQVVRILSDKAVYTSILTGKERGTNTKLIFGTVRLDLTKILRKE